MTELKKGDKAPFFKGETDNEGVISLDDYKGKKLALYFYPKDNTPGCTAQACNITENYDVLNKHDISIIGVSPDSVKKHENFREKYNLPFPLLADVDKEALNAYGVWGKKKFMGREYDGVHRVTFLIDDGQIVDVISKVKTKDHTRQILEGFGVEV